MIEKMKKFTFLVTNKEYDGFISSIREQGVVHVQQLQQGASSAELQSAMELEQRYKAALLAVDVAAKKYQVEEHTVPAAASASPEAILKHLEDLQSEELNLMHRVDEAEKNIRALEPWGEFSSARLAQLSEACGMKINFFRCNSKYFKPDWREQYFATPVNDLNKNTYFLTFSEETPDIQAEQIFLPKGALSEYHAERDELNRQLTDTRGEMLYAFNHLRPQLEAGHTEAQNAISLATVHLSDESVAGDALRLLIGWVQADKTDSLTAYLEEAHIYYEMEDPAFEDDVPIKITNGSYTRLFEPILRMYSLPNYHDLDPSLFFAPFFMLFFGLCLGDGGYGMLVFLGSLALAKMAPDDMKDYARLGIWLGGMTVICGLMTGTVFGLDLTQQDWAILAPVKPYFLSDNGVGPIFGYSPMMVISVGLGMIQVLIGMTLKAAKAWKNFGWPYAVSTLSWVVALIAAIALYGLPACGVELTQIVQYILLGIIGLSALGIFFYNNPASYKNPALGLLSNIGGGVWATYGMATGLLGDLLSYIRLFALGLTGGVLGSVFNSLAYDMTASLPWMIRWLPMVLILLAGHGITFALSMISAFVHPMRLTFVEFFKNADFEGGGHEYNPFRVRKGNE